MGAIAGQKDFAAPLYVRIPSSLHDYLQGIKDRTGIGKGDTVTLILYAASRFVDFKTILEMFDKYMLDENFDDIIKDLVDELKL